MKFSNKKGVMFAILYPVFLLLFVGALAIGISQMQKGVYDDKFTATNSYYDLKNLAYTNELSIETYVSGLLLTSKNDFLTSNVDIKSDCNYKNYILWYNEKEVGNPASNLKNGMCLSSINKSLFVNSYVDFLQAKIDTGLKSFFEKNGETLSSQINVDSTSGKIDVLISTSGVRKAMNNEIKIEKEYKIEGELLKYSDLVFDVSSILPQFSKKVKEEIIGCKKIESSKVSNINSDIELVCLQQIFESMLSSDVKNSYDFEVSKIKEFGINDYYALNFIVKKKGTDKVELSFSGIFDYNIPLGVVDYTLSSVSGMDNVLNVEIKKLAGSVTPQNYVILYSYNNFVDKSNPKYKRLMYLLENSKLPDDLIKVDLGLGGDLYYHSPKGSDLDLSVIVTDNLSFDSNDKKKVMLYQKYNKDTGDYELLSNNKKVYVLVFAVDSRFNYYTDENLLNSNLKSEISKSDAIPMLLLTPQNLKFENGIKGYGQLFSLEVSNYDDSTFAFYNLYVKEKSSDKFVYGCKGMSNCEFVNDIIVSSPNSKILVTSDLGGVDSTLRAKYDKIVDLKSLKLMGGVEYDVLLVPVNSNGVGTLDSYSKEYEFVERVRDATKVYTREKSGISLIVSNLNIKVSDLKAPLLSEINYPATLRENSGLVYFDWSSKVGDEITSVYVEGVESYAGGTRILKALVEKDGLVFVKKADTVGISITHVFPIDTSGNPDINSNEFNSIKDNYKLPIPINWP